MEYKYLNMIKLNKIIKILKWFKKLPSPNKKNCKKKTKKNPIWLSRTYFIFIQIRIVTFDIQIQIKKKMFCFF